MAEKSVKPSKEAVIGLQDQVLASLSGSAAPEGAQAGILKGGVLEKIVKKLIPALLEGVPLVADGSVSPDDARRLVEIAVRTVQELIAMRRSLDAAS